MRAGAALPRPQSMPRSLDGIQRIKLRRANGPRLGWAGGYCHPRPPFLPPRDYAPRRVWDPAFRSHRRQRGPIPPSRSAHAAEDRRIAERAHHPLREYPSQPLSSGPPHAQRSRGAGCPRVSPGRAAFCALAKRLASLVLARPRSFSLVLARSRLPNASQCWYVSNAVQPHAVGLPTPYPPVPPGIVPPGIAIMRLDLLIPTL